MYKGYGAPTTNPRGQEAQSTTASIDSFQPHKSRDHGLQIFNPTWQTVESTPSNAEPVWRLPDYTLQPDSEGYQKEEIVAILPEYYVNSDPENFTCSGFSRMRVDDYLSSETEAANSIQDRIQRGYHDDADLAWGLSPLTTSSQERFFHRGCRSARSPSSHTLTPSTPGGPAWLSVADSAYGSLPNSRHGSRSGQADAMMHAGHYFAIPEEGDSPGETGQAPLLARMGAKNETLPDVGEVSTAKAGHTEQNQRSRQDAHSKVEKRYRMNINNKIEQLRRILPTNSSSEHQCLSQIAHPAIHGVEKAVRNLAKAMSCLSQLQTSSNCRMRSSSWPRRTWN